MSRKTNLLESLQKLKNCYYVLRHGQSLANVQGIIASNPDIACTEYGLSNLGIEQVETAVIDIVNAYNGVNVNNNNINSSPYYNGLVIVSSDFRRALETATIVANGIVERNAKHHRSSSVKILKQDEINIANDCGNKDNQTMTTNELEDVSFVKIDTRLRERWFGHLDLQADTNYELVWENDAWDSSHTRYEVESVDSVMERVTSIILDLEQSVGIASNHTFQPTTLNESTFVVTNNESATRNGENLDKDKRLMIVLVAHGDVLQILQTAFLKISGTQHRSIQHLETATLRQLIFSSSSC